MAAKASEELLKSFGSSQEVLHHSWEGYCTAAQRICPPDQDCSPYVRFTSSWSTRAAVRKPLLSVDEIYLNEMPDFLPELLPFREHPIYLSASSEEQQRVLTCGWLA